MDQRLAARWLQDAFYLYVLSKANPPERIPKVLTRNGHELPTAANCASRRARLLPEDFRFTWPNLPKGACYIEPCAESNG